MAIDVGKTLQGALDELVSEKDRINRQIAALRLALDGTAKSTAPGRPQRRMTAAARRAIGQRMKAYWAKRRAETAKSAVAEASGKGIDFSEGDRRYSVGPAVGRAASNAIAE